MGKTTLYHPVSLNVLRGALEYGGFTVGKFRQHNADREGMYASYEVEIKSWPANLDQISPELLKTHLNNCFASDVDFQSVWITRTGKRMAHLLAHIEPVPARHPEAIRYEDLSPDERTKLPF